MTFGCNPHGQSHIILWKGRWWLPPNLGHGESCEFIYVHGSSMHQKCFNYALTNLLLGLCTSIWIIDLLVTCPSPHPKTPTHPRPQNVMNKRTYPNSFFCCFHFGTCISVKQGVWVCVMFLPSVINYVILKMKWLIKIYYQK
jgi:hypothetical protein